MFRSIRKSKYVRIAYVRENSRFVQSRNSLLRYRGSRPAVQAGCIVRPRRSSYTIKCIIVGALNVNYGHLGPPRSYLANFSLEIRLSRIHGIPRIRGPRGSRFENASKNKRPCATMSHHYESIFAPVRFARLVCYTFLASPRDKCCMSRSWSCHLSYEYLQVRFAVRRITRGTRAFVHQWSHATFRCCVVLG